MCLGCFFCGSCAFIIAFVNDITNDMSRLNVPALHKRHRKKMEKRFHNISQDFADAKELSGKKSKILLLIKSSNSFLFLQFLGLLKRSMYAVNTI